MVPEKVALVLVLVLALGEGAGGEAGEEAEVETVAGKTMGACVSGVCDPSGLGTTDGTFRF